MFRQIYWGIETTVLMKMKTLLHKKCLRYNICVTSRTWANPHWWGHIMSLCDCCYVTYIQWRILLVNSIHYREECMRKREKIDTYMNKSICLVFCIFFRCVSYSIRVSKRVYSFIQYNMIKWNCACPFIHVYTLRYHLKCNIASW